MKLITLPSLEVVMQLWSTTPRQSLLPLPLAMSNWTSQLSETYLGQIGSMQFEHSQIAKVQAGFVLYF